MKTIFHFKLIIGILILSLYSLTGLSFNPEVSNYLTNLSEGEEGPGFSDVAPELVISGNTIHVVWTQYLSSWQEGESKLYYRRSTDLGETWEAPKELMVYKYGVMGTGVMTRRLAVDGDNVHICAADYDFDDNNGTGKLHYFRSQNGGVSFESERIIAASAGGGYTKIVNCFIKASNGKVAVSYQGEGDKKGTWAMFSDNNGDSFSDTNLSDESSYVADMYFDGGKIIVLYGYQYYMYGFHTGRLWVSTSGNGTDFTTNKLSVVYETQYGDREKCRAIHHDHYSPKVTCTDNAIHILFTGEVEEGNWTTFYARSNNNGQSFELFPNIGADLAGNFTEGSETLAAKNGNVYFLAASEYKDSGSKFYFAYSQNNGNSFSTPRSIMNPDISHVGRASLPGITIDPTDETGKTLYLTGNWLFSTKTVDGGETFSGSTSLAPFLKSNITNMSHNYMVSYMKTDAAGGLHWITQAEWRDGNDKDIFYRNVKAQPDPGTKNKAFYVENIEETSGKTDLVVVPSSESIQFDSAMTAEVWVKFNPATKTSKFSILGKVDGYDGYDYRPEGYHIGFRCDDESIYANAGLKTDKDGVVNWGEIDINDNVWHHIALTYNANGGLNNFKLFIDGLLHKQQTLTGAIIEEDGMLMLGARNMGSGWYDDAKYYMDDVRLWNRALTQEELLENQTNKLTGKEDGLALFINFDDTFKDITGNGNDGIPVYYGALQQSDFDPPLTGFDFYQTGNSISLNNKTENATSWLWNFGDENTSEQGNPKHTFSDPGEYQVALTAKNATTAASAASKLTIEGLERIEPDEAGNFGYSTLTVFGGGITDENTLVILRKDGEEDIVSNKVNSEAEGSLTALFDLSEKTLGNWDVVVSQNGAEMVLDEALTITQGEMPDPWVNITGRGLILYNMWQTYTINYGNNGNSDAYGVPLWIALTDYPEMEIEFIDFKIQEPAANAELGITGISDSIPLYFIADEYFTPQEKARVYPLYIPKIPANSTASIHIRIKSPGDFDLETWVSDPFFTGDTIDLKSSQEDVPFSEMDNDARACIGLSIGKVVAEGMADLIGTAIPIGCINSMVTTFYNPWDYKPKDHKDDVPTLGSTAWQMSSLIINCAGDLPYFKAFKITVKVAQLAASMYDAYQADKACREAWKKKSGNKRGIGAVSSFDPNEMVGPSGFGEQNYITKNNMMPYTIMFENKSEATAPAHIVTITDTLDLSVFDISEFGFGSFGWGDTILSPPGNQLKEFSMDVDLSPAMQLITRVSGKLDTITGVVTWEFLSLNPETMNLEEDPFLGFLPPNVNPPEGDGFVSFSVGLKEELGTNDEIRNQATIVFDANEPIMTNEFINILDIDAPESQVYQLETNSTNNYTVEWAGTDVGSGISHYDIYVMVNDTLLYPWLTNVSETTSQFNGEVGSTYKFYSIVSDNVSNMEEAPVNFDAETTIIVNIEEFEQEEETLTVWPNPVKNNLNVQLINATFGMYVVELVNANGTLIHSMIYEGTQLQNCIDIDVSKFHPGTYVLRVVYGNKTENRKVVIQ